MKRALTTIALASLLTGGLWTTIPAQAESDWQGSGSVPPAPNYQQGNNQWQPGSHWGWLNGHDASGGEGWIYDEPRGRQYDGARRYDDAGARRSPVMSRDDRRAVMPGYHWGWLNGRDASGGAGWIDDRTGRPLERGYGERGYGERGYGARGNRE